MPAIPVHHTATTDEPWDGGAAERNLPEGDQAAWKKVYAWYDASGADEDGDGLPDAKADWKFPHHSSPGAPANLNACRNVLARVGGSDVPDGDKPGIEAHAQAHLDDAAGKSATAPIGRRGYGHVTRALVERPWAIQPQVLAMMADVLRLRVEGNPLSDEEIAQRVAAADAQNGDRAGGTVIGSVAVIPMYGVLSQRMNLMSSMSGGTSLDELRSSLDAALRDPAVSAVVFDIDSPGGATDGVTEFAAYLRAARSGSKPIVAQVNTLAASAAYWLASSMGEIAMTPSGEVGSVGVFAVHEDQSKAEEMAGVKTTIISAGPFKAELAPSQPLSDEARAAVQEQVDAFYQMFLADVARGRRVTTEQVAQSYGQGRTLLARNALAAGMVDRIDTLEATVHRLQASAAATTGRRPAALSLVSLPARAASGAGSIQPDRAWNQRMRRRLR